MQFADDDGRGVRLGDAAAREHGQPVPRDRDQAGDQVGAVEGGGRRRGGEQPVGAEREDVVERGQRVGDDVEGTVERHAGRTGGGDQVGAQNAVDGAATGERAEHDADYLYVSLGTGIGAAIVSDGQLRDGAHQHADELGHIVIDPSGPPCACGGRGCLETFMSAAALGYPADRSGADRPGPGRRPRRQRAVAGGDRRAGVRAAHRRQPARSVGGGGLAHAGQHLVGPLGRSIRARSRGFQSIGDLRLAAHGDWSNCADAAAAARHQLSAPA